MKVIPLTLSQANELITAWHRHHKPATGHRFSIGCLLTVSCVVGAAIVGRPVARKTDQYLVAEVTRLVTTGEKNVCSFLYSACARIAREMGFDRIQTFILEEEPPSVWAKHDEVRTRPEFGCIEWEKRTGK